MSTRIEQGEVAVRPCRGPEEYPALVTVWRRSVDATHDFLAPEHRDEIEAKLASDYFPAVHLWIAERGGVAVGFAGVSGHHLEMLFVDADRRGHGIGTVLLGQVMDDGVVSVDVNEQNEQATQFYRQRGFQEVGRSACDEQGRPYPILHLAREVSAA